MRVLMIGCTNNLGGIETFTHNYYSQLKNYDIKIDFINMYDRICFQDEYEKNNSKIYKIINYRKHPIKYIKELCKIIKDNEYDIVHFNMNSAVFLYPLISAKICSVPGIIAHSHNASNDMGLLKSILHNVMKKFIPFFANTYFACSKKAGDWFFSKKIIKSSNFYVIENAIDIDKYRFDIKIRQKKQEELNINPSTFVIGHVGRFNKQKNHIFLIEMFYKYNKINNNSLLLLIGCGPLLDEIKCLTKKLKLEDNVKFLGQRHDVNELYQLMDVFTLPSLYEGLPLVGVEAQMSGCYCLFSNEITEEVKINRNIDFLKISCVEPWVNRIIEIEKSDFDRNCKTNSYNIKKSAEKLFNIYKLLGGKNK